MSQTRSSRPLSGLHGTYDLKHGDSLDLVLSWGRSHRHHRFDAEAMLEADPRLSGAPGLAAAVADLERSGHSDFMEKA